MARVTSRDVAMAAGVSQSTVSFVLNGRRTNKISERTRAQVLAAARELGYVPSAAARSLRTGRSEVVLCVIQDFVVSQATEEFKIDLSDALAQRGFTCVFLHLRDDRSPSGDLWQHIHPAAVLAFGDLPKATAGEVRASEAVLIEGVFAPERGRELTGIDQYEVGRLQARHLAERGHRQICHLAVDDPREERFARPRREGVREECARLGLPAPQERALIGLTADVAMVEDLLAAGATAVAAFNDLTAVALLDTARQAGVAVPGRLAVVGVDDLRIASIVTPRLTTIRMDLRAAAHRLAGLVSGFLTDSAGPCAAAPLMETPFRLIVRDST